MSAAGRGSLEDLKAFKNPPPSVQSSARPRLFNRMLARRRKPYIIEDLAASPHGNHWWAEHFQLKSLAYYPLRTKDKLIGFMSVACVDEKRRFPQEEIESLAAIAKQAAVIIENARLYEKTAGATPAGRGPCGRSDGRRFDAQPEERVGSVVPDRGRHQRGGPREHLHDGRRWDSTLNQSCL